jgi:hypothetical protein
MRDRTQERITQIRMIGRAASKTASSSASERRMGGMAGSLGRIDPAHRLGAFSHSGSLEAPVRKGGGFFLAEKPVEFPARRRLITDAGRNSGARNRRHAEMPGERHHIVRRPAHDADQRILPVIPV